MKRLDMFPKFADEDVFDAQMDFSMFLEEARKHARQEKAKEVAASANDAVGADEKRRKKSWKSSFFFWRKSEKKVKPENQILPTESTGIGKLPRRSATSGPIYGSGGGAAPTNRNGRHRPNSGPLSALFTPSRRREFEVPYMCLDQLNNNLTTTTTTTTTTAANMAFGPIYLVT